jgi:hypothetical protein
MKRMMKLGLLVAFATAGCGGGSSGGASRFIGTWSYSSGTQTTTCNDFVPPTSTDQLTGSVLVSAGISSDLVTNDGEGCLLKFDVVGGVGDVIPGQSCGSSITFTDGTAGTLTITPQTWTLSLLNNTVMNSSGSGAAMVQAAGATYPCTFSVTSMLNKATH